MLKRFVLVNQTTNLCRESLTILESAYFGSRSGLSELKSDIKKHKWFTFGYDLLFTGFIRT